MRPRQKGGAPESALEKSCSHSGAFLSTAARPTQTHRRFHRLPPVSQHTILSSARILPDPARMDLGETRAHWWHMRRLGADLPAEIGVIVIAGGKP